MNVLMWKKTSCAFTLVELIVVITILSILSTIAFFSVSQYAREARNSRKIGDIVTITTKIPLEEAKGVNLLAFAANDNATLTGTSIRIAGLPNYDTFSWSYTAGDLNYIALESNTETIQDSVFWVPYKYGATLLAGWLFEIAATIEGETDLDTYVSGNWLPRTSSETRGPRESITDNIFYLSGMTYYETGFEIGDLVWISSGEYTIIDMRNENEIHLDQTITTPGANIFLKRDETRHLIKKWDSNFPINSGSGSLFVPYK